MPETNNRAILRRAGLRWLRVAAAGVLASVIPSLIDLLPQLELGPELRGLLVAILIPTLVALDKLLRERAIY